MQTVEAGRSLPRCELCGNECEKPLEVRREGVTHVYDCLECAVHSLAPVCGQCGCRIMRRPVEIEDRVFCSANCAAIYYDPGFHNDMHQLVMQ